MLREHLEAIQRQTHRPHPDLENLVELPDSMKECWGWFLRLNSKRQSGMGISAISYQEMQAFFNLLGINPELDEIEILEMFDRIAVETISAQQEKEKAQQEARTKKK